MNGEEFLQSKDIWHHPRVSTRNSDVSYDIAELLDEFLEAHTKQKLNIHGVMQAEGSDGEDGAAVASEGDGEANTCAGCGTQNAFNGVWIEGAERCYYCGDARA